MKIASDTWLAQILERDVYNLQINDTQPDVHELEKLLSGLEGERSFLYSKIGSDQVKKLSLLLELGFKLVEINLTYEKDIVATVQSIQPVNDIKISYADKNDEKDVVDIARRNIIYSRFHTDKKIGKNMANKLKGEWARNYFRGKRGDKMIVVKRNKVVVGFLQAVYDNNHTLVIDLIAVDGPDRGKGLAQRMISYAEENSEGFCKYRASTQLVNVPSVRLYEKNGFRLFGSSYVLHYHKD